MAILTHTNLEVTVAGYMDIAVTDLDDAWLKACALDSLRWLLPLAPEYAVESILEEEAGSGSTGVDIQAASPVPLKVASVRSATGGHHRYVPPEQFESIRKAYADGATSFGPGRCIWSDVGGKIYTFRETASVTVRYIGAPAWDTDNLTVPNGWENLVAIYCVVQHKLADEETEQAMAMQQLLQTELQRFQGFENVPVSVGG